MEEERGEISISLLEFHPVGHCGGDRTERELGVYHHLGPV